MIKKTIFYRFMMLITVVISTSLNAQTVSGIVQDEIGPLYGVNVNIKGTALNTVTDFDGKFTFAKVDGMASLVFSYTGFITQTVAVNKKSIVNVVLKTDENKLDEVVVVGYNSMKKKDVIEAISKINMEDFDKSVSPYISQSLQGLASGVRVTSNTGAPGDGAQIRIRGISSLNGNNAPLYIVDGIATLNAMDNLSPLDIANITVLKDAASTAIYGSRASNGVVIITTKNGKKGQAAKISLTVVSGVQSHGKLTKMTNKDQYVEIYNEAADNDNAMLTEDQAFLKRKKISAEYAATLPNINQLESVFRDALSQQYNLGVSWGTDNTTVNLSGSYFNQEGILQGSSYSKANAYISVDTKVNKWFDIGVKSNIYSSENNIVGSSGDGYGGNGGSAIRYAFFRTPAIPIYNAVGGFVDKPDRPDLFGDGYNPVGFLANTDNVRKQNGMFGDVHLKFTLSDDFFIVSTFGLDQSNFKQRRFNKTWGDLNRINNPNSLSVGSNSVLNATINSVLNYVHTFNEVHNITAIAGVESVNNREEYYEATDRDFADQNPLLVTLGNGRGLDSGSQSLSQLLLESYFAKGNYNYDSRYFLTGVIRRDGSSNFAEGHKWGNFYSASLGWRIDKDFFKESETVERWMLRAGYGSVGDQQIPAFSYASLIGRNYDYPFGGITQPGSAVVTLGNQNLSWATSKQFDLGTDISLFKGQLDLTFDYFNKNTEDMLLSISMPPSNGDASPPIFNSGNVLNYGYEFDFTYNNRVSDDFSFSINGNATYLHNEVTALNAPILAGRIDNGVYATKTEVGHPIGSFFLYTQDGIFQNKSEILTSAYQGDNVQPGDVKYKDINNDGVINESDRSHVGSAIPEFYYGLTISLKYKNFDFDIFSAGATGSKIYNQINTDIEGFYRPFNVTERYFDERWTGEGTSNTQPRASWSAKSNNTKPSTRFLEDGSFIRVKNVQLGYSFDKRFLEKSGISKLRLYVTASNLWTFTKYSGLDPEFTTNDNSKGEGDLAAGIDFGTYPNSMVFQYGLQITF